MAKKKTRKRRTPRERAIQNVRNELAVFKRMQKTYGDDFLERGLRGGTRKGGA